MTNPTATTIQISILEEATDSHDFSEEDVPNLQLHPLTHPTVHPFASIMKAQIQVLVQELLHRPLNETETRHCRQV